jgi:outer membrane protein OmpA-like peptidoglycan-associated protein
MLKYIYTTIICLFAVQGVFAQKIERSIVYFEFNQAYISSDYQSVLDSISRKMLYSPNDTLFLIGHTDNVGSEKFNQRLSAARVASVSRYLEQRGINPERINIKYYGEEHPIAQNDEPQGRQLNRRVDVLVRSPRFICKYELANNNNK